MTADQVAACDIVKIVGQQSETQGYVETYVNIAVAVLDANKKEMLVLLQHGVPSWEIE